MPSLLSPLEERILKRLIKSARTTRSEATAAALRKVRAKLRAQPVNRADEPRLYAIATALAELARLQSDRDRAARILERCARVS